MINTRYTHAAIDYISIHSCCDKHPCAAKTILARTLDIFITRACADTVCSQQKLLIWCLQHECVHGNVCYLENVTHLNLDPLVFSSVALCHPKYRSWLVIVNICYMCISYMFIVHGMMAGWPITLHR